MTAKDWTDEYLRMVDDCEKRESYLSDWERGFIDSIGKRLLDKRPLSQKQTEVLDKIWDRVTK